MERRATRAVWTIGLSLTLLAGCSGEAPTQSEQSQPEHVGSVGLRLQPVLGVTVNSVRYIVTAGDPASNPPPAIVAEGNLPTPGTSSDASFGLPLPVGTGYFMSTSAVSNESSAITCVGQNGPFDVTPTTSPQLSLALVCDDNSGGTAEPLLTEQTDACPSLIIDFAIFNPVAAAVGHSISLNAQAHDTDNPNELIHYAWSILDPAAAGAGVFVPANQGISEFTCLAPRASIKVGVNATNHECSKLLIADVSCTAPQP
jgi:hypothetical protein